MRMGVVRDVSLVHSCTLQHTKTSYLQGQIIYLDCTYEARALIPLGNLVASGCNWPEASRDMASQQSSSMTYW